ncbi:MAG: T9SS type A sorting domain-containing protein [Bacteroidetes bacterium]|nr:MAG: T9SS type A sorting domain-containing protein [Bacteroidota bacterium]
MKRILLITALSCLTANLYAQSPEIRRGGLRITDSVYFHANTQSLFQEDSSQRTADRALALRMGLPMMMNQNGQFAEFQYFNTLGQPIYYTVDNLDAAKTISTNKLWLNGGLGLNLSGDSMFIGVWDGGKVRNTHVELVNRVQQMDGATTLSNHATHVSGTLAASGVKATAKGMSYKTQVRAYDWNLDEAEMNQAAANGMLVSNHSYGYIAGWYNNTDKSRWEWYGDTNISATEDYKYGNYDNQARDWDEIANDNPYYLIVKSAGNDRGKKLPATETTYWLYDRNQGFVQSSTPRPATGPYDCIAGAGVSKNVLTVGAVNAITTGYTKPSDVVMSGFSGWGPTDDGRIKPDVVGNGVGVNSSIASGDNAYASYNGTSMSSPNVAGSLLLWQEHHKKLFGTYMRAATLKGMAIHTADEAGSNPGPDYSFGWGLVNSAKAVQLMSNIGTTDQFHELSLANQSTYELVVYNDGSTPLYATISWNDPAAVGVQLGFDLTTPKLVNDLDLRIVRVADQNEFKPWILDPANPANAATTGDNYLDNVEQVKIQTPQAGYYRITVSHKGTLSQSQAYSLIISGLQPSVQAGAQLPSGQSCTENGIPLNFNGYGNPDQVRWTFYGPDTIQVFGAQTEVHFSLAGTYDMQQWVKSSYNEDSLFTVSAFQVLASPAAKMDKFFAEQFCSNDTAALPLSGSANMAFTGGGVNQGKWKASETALGEHYIYGQVTGGNGCVNRDSIRVEILEAPTVPLVTLQADSQLKSSATAGNYWLFNGQFLPNDTLQFVKPEFSGFYSVEVRGANGCSSRSALYPYYFTSTTLPENLGMSLYPNPNTGLVQIKLDFEGLHEIKLFDMQGRQLMSKSAEKMLELDLSFLANGTYLIQVDERSPQKLILHR